MGWIKKNPIATLGGIVVVLTLFAGGAQAQHLVPDKVIAWILLIISVITGFGSWAAHQSSTSLAQPKAADGTPLVPVDQQPPTAAQGRTV